VSHKKREHPYFVHNFNKSGYIFITFSKCHCDDSGNRKSANYSSTTTTSLTGNDVNGEVTKNDVLFYVRHGVFIISYQYFHCKCITQNRHLQYVTYIVSLIKNKTNLHCPCLSGKHRIIKNINIHSL